MAYRYCEFLHRLHMLDRQPPISTRKRKLYKQRFNPLTELSEEDFKTKYRFSKNSMEKLIALVKEEEDLKGDRRGGHISADLQVMAAIGYWCCNEAQDDAADIHGISQPTLSMITKRVGKAFASKAKQYIAMPQTDKEQIEIIDKYKTIRGFPHVIGAIGCNHIRIKNQGGENGQDYVNNKGYSSINVQAVCDPDLKIRDIICHWRGSTHASHIYNESSIKDRLESGEFGGRLLGDNGYACTNHLFTPVNNPENSSEENYNIAHKATHNTIEQTFKIWKSRFKILVTGMRGSLDNIKTTVLALSVLHNLAIEYNDALDHEEDFQEINNKKDGSLSPENHQHLSYGEETARTAFIATHFK